jgi:glycosyltransferase involved in cell wall biosynthesis
VKVLALLSDCPWPPNTGSRVRNAYLWPALQRLGVEVRLLALDQPGAACDAPPAGAELELHAFGREPWPARAYHVLRHSYHQWPVSPSLRSRAARLAAEWRPDVIHAEELRMAAYTPARAAPAPVRTLTLHNVESDLLRHTGSTALRFGRAAIERAHLRALLAFERRAVLGADLAFAYSAADLARYRELYPAARWAETRNGTHASLVMPAPQPAAPSALLVGSLGYAPNVHGLYWFLDHVLPLLPRDLRVTVAGSRAGDEVRRRLAASPVRFEDTPADLAPLYAEHAVSVVPVFEGSGTRGKILESLAYERAVVTTTPGAGGLELAEGEGFVLADDAEGFAAKVARLAASPGERAELARRGRAAVLARYDWSGVARDLLAAWTACAVQRARAG